MPKPVPIPTARDLMGRTVVSLRPDQTLEEAMVALRVNSLSGAPVLDEKGELVGMLSEFDCLKVLASDEFFEEDHPTEHTVGGRMSTDLFTISAEMDLYAIAHVFLKRGIRRLPVVEEGRLIGVVSRRDALRGVERIWETRRRHGGEKPKGLFLSATDADPNRIDARNSS